MISTNTTSLLCVVRNSIVLNPKSRNKKQISFSEISKIHISVRQRQFALKGFLVGYFIFTLICLRYLNLELSVFSLLIFGVNFIVINSIDFKSYRLQIILKNNTVIEKRVSKKVKYELIPIIHEVRNKLALT